MSYDAMRHFADSWGLVFMGLSYLILIGWHFQPGARRRSAWTHRRRRDRRRVGRPCRRKSGKKNPQL